MSTAGGALAACVTRHPLWRRIASAVSVEAGTLLATGHRHRRLELCVAQLDGVDVGEVEAMRCACAHCGASIKPFRRRAGKSAGRAERPGRLFLALSCELGDSVGCSRGNACTAAYERVIRDLEARRRGPSQLRLF